MEPGRLSTQPVSCGLCGPPYLKSHAGRPALRSTVTDLPAANATKRKPFQVRPPFPEQFPKTVDSLYLLDSTFYSRAGSGPPDGVDAPGPGELKPHNRSGMLGREHLLQDPDEGLGEEKKEGFIRPSSQAMAHPLIWSPCVGGCLLR